MMKWTRFFWQIRCFARYFVSTRSCVYNKRLWITCCTAQFKKVNICIRSWPRTHLSYNISVYCRYPFLRNVTMCSVLCSHIMTAYWAMTPKLQVWPECALVLCERMFIQPVMREEVTVCVSFWTVVCVQTSEVKKRDNFTFCGQMYSRSCCLLLTSETAAKSDMEYFKNV